MNSQSKKMLMVQKLFNPSQYRLSNNLGTLNKDNYIRAMSESISKAIDSEEGPVKEKHVRRLLIASFQFESGQFFWDNLPVIRLKENQIVCWKFCHVLHKMIRDGHKEVFVSFYKHRKILLDCGNMWRHVTTGYGQLIYAYCELLFNRGRFFDIGYPSDLVLEDVHFENWAKNDTTGDLMLETVICLLDAIDAILLLADKVLDSFTTKRLNSISRAGKCHLSPLVACIQDTIMLYDAAVKILFKLHAKISTDFLEFPLGRFTVCHNRMRDLFVKVRNLQYFKTLIQIPHLSERPPNFRVASELEQHVLPQVIMLNDNNERESPDNELLVNIDDEDDTSLANDQPDSTMTSMEYEALASSSSAAPHGPASEPGMDQSNLVELDKVRSKSDETIRELVLKIQELESTLTNLSAELQQEKLDHQKTKENGLSERDSMQSDMSRLRQDVSNLRHQLAASKNAYDKLAEETKRAVHDNEIKIGRAHV